MNNLSSKPNKSYTLIFLIQNEQVLLGMKKRGFGEGKWNGFGGKVEANETVRHGAIREMQEECGVIIQDKDLKLQGFITFDIDNVPEKLFRVHVFTAQVYSGDVIETEEMKPQWFKINEIPYKSMWVDDEFWYPIMFQNKLFNGFFHFKDFDTVVDQNMTILECEQQLKEIIQKNSDSKLE